MELQGEQLIRAPRAQVWVALNDPHTLSKCIPGCEEVNRISDTELEARLFARIGPVRARFGGRIQMSDVVVDQGCRMAFEGSGGAAGMAKGASQVTLVDEGQDTRLQYTVQAAVGGKLGQIGGRLIDASAKKMADEFFEALNQQLAPASNGTEDAHPTRSTEGSARPAAAPERSAAAHGRATPIAVGPSWAGELQRVFWLALGVGIGAAVCHLARF